MSKGKIYTLLVSVLSFSVVFGGWFLTKQLLNQKKTEMLKSSGQVALQSSETTWFGETWLDHTQSKSDFVGVELSENEIKKILEVWESGADEVPHEPLEGQMDMEQAIMEGRNWISNLSEQGILPAYLAECSFDKTSAKLCKPDAEVTFDEYLLSYWQNIYVEGDVKIILTINAATGQIWKADISMNESRMLNGTYTDEDMLKIIFPFITEQNSKVFAKLKRSQIVADKQEPQAELTVWLTTDKE